MKEHEKWVLVRDVSELKPGMVFKTTIQGFAGVVLRKVEDGYGCPSRWEHQCCMWKSTVCPRGCFQAGVDRRSLFRLETGQSDEEQQREGRDLYAPKKVGVKA